MTSHSRQIGLGGFAPAVRVLGAACAVFLAAPALAQEPRPPAEIPSQSQGDGAADAAPSAPSSSVSGPTVIDTIGRWLDDGTSKLKSDWQGAQKTFDALTDQTRDAAKDATGAVVGLPNMRIMPVRERCAVTANGGPDCQAAAMAACRGKGFSTGKSLDTQSEQKCPQVLLRGRAPNDIECRTETFVTRALCQ